MTDKGRCRGEDSEAIGWGLIEVWVQGIGRDLNGKKI
jgi:hypothetical protein